MGARFSPPVHTGSAAHSLLYNGYLVFTGGKLAGEWCWPPTPPRFEFKERVQLYSSSGPSKQVTGWTLPFTVSEWDYARSKKWEVYWWMENGKDIEWSKSLINVRCCPRVSRGWLGEATRITSPWQPIFGSALQAVTNQTQRSVTNLTEMFTELEEMKNVQERKWNEANVRKEDINSWYLTGPS